MVTATKWYKCDLQVATPGWDFKGQAPTDDPVQRAEFCDTYMRRLAAKGIEVIALADHHGATWLAEMRAAGQRAGITVFPGVEVTTGSGSDGIHIVIIGDLSRTEDDVNLLLHTACGFSAEHPLFIPGTRQPAASPRSIGDILDKLGDGWFTIAVHALSHSGLAGTSKGTVRWKALHHDKLNAIDPGRPGTEVAKSGFNAAFRARSLDNLPRLRDLAFISTSDGYDLEAIGRRFTWIRMAEPSLEGLRQAALDHEARIICDSDERLNTLKDRDPNNVGHAWIESVRIDGTIGNSASPFEVPLNPRLNVIIGGRGTGKSTIVAGLRHLYSDTANLPTAIRGEAERFAEQVLKHAVISATHRLAHSGEQQRAHWTVDDGPVSVRGGQRVKTAFPVRVFSQKELFELTTNTSNDPHAASRYLLKLVDAELKLEESTNDHPAGRSASRKDAAAACVAAVAKRRATQDALARLPGIKARHSELRRQVEAFGDPASQNQRATWEETLRAHVELGAQADRLHDALSHALADIEARLGVVAHSPEQNRPAAAQPHFDELTQIHSQALEQLRDAVKHSQSDLAQAREQQKHSAWAAQAKQAETAILGFQNSLDELGIDASQYLSLREELATTEAAISKLTLQAAELDASWATERAAWDRLDQFDDDVRDVRRVFLRRIGTASGSLRFKVTARANVTAWTESVRTRLNLRGNAFLDDVPDVANWLWDTDQEEAERARRLQLWRTALSDSDFTSLRAEGICRSDWWSRLSRADQAVRVGLATLTADDIVEMSFLREGGDQNMEADWQPVSTGSPGQRTAAMLGFVLNHGDEPLILDQPEDDLDAALITSLIVSEVRRIRWHRQVVIVTHNANIPVIGDAESVVVMASDGRSLGPKTSQPDGISRAVHIGPIEVDHVRRDIQEILEGGQAAFKARERRYQNDLNRYHEALDEMRGRHESAQ